MDKIKKYRYHAVLLICFICLLWRSFKGFCWTDESFYISTADRFFRGDIPLVDEWFRTQMSSVLMLPFYALYVLITGGNTGIVLYFRILYLLLSSVVAFMFFKVLSKEYPKGVSTVAALFVMCYAHLNITTFSYYMLSELFMSLALILIYDHKFTRSRAELVVSGISIAFSVMCMPIFVIGYVLVMAAVFAVMAVARFAPISDRTKAAIDDLKLWDITKYTIAGIAIPAVITLVYVLSRADISRIIETLPYMLIDNEHQNTWGYIIRKPHRCLMDVFGYWTYGSYILIAVSFAFQRLLKDHPLREITVFLAGVIFAADAVMAWGHTGYIQVAFLLFALPVFFTSPRKNIVLFWLFVIPALLVAAIYCFASSDFLYVIAIGCAIATGAGVCAAYDHALSLTKEEGTSSMIVKAAKVMLTVVCLFALAVTFYLRIVNVYRDAPLTTLTATIPEGVAKGIATTPEHRKQYEDVYETINEYCMDKEKSVMFSKILPWGYAASSMKCAYPTTWRSTAYSNEQLDVYYDELGHDKPDVILVLDEQYGSFDAAGDTEDDHNPNLNEMSPYWEEYIRSNGMEGKKVRCGTLYITY